eukprot:437450-Ditylum_brightwellii.AAC.1
MHEKDEKSIVTNEDKGSQIVSEEGKTEEPVEKLKFEIRVDVEEENDSCFDSTKEEREVFGLVEADKKEIELEVDPPAPAFGIMVTPAEELLEVDCVTTACTADEFNILEVIVKKTDHDVLDSKVLRKLRDADEASLITKFDMFWTKQRT